MRDKPDTPSTRLTEKPVFISSDRRVQLAVFMLLTIQILLVGYRGLKESYTWDEPAHLAAGLHHLEYSRFDMYRVNPPLVHLNSAIVPELAGCDSPTFASAVKPGTRPEFSLGKRFVEANGFRSFWLLTFARWSCIWIPVLGGYVCYRWSVQLFGVTAGLLTLSLWTFSPTVLANSALITPDVASAVAGVLAIYSFWLWTRSRTYWRGFCVGLAIGFALLIKTMWIILFALVPVCWLVSHCFSQRLAVRQEEIHPPFKTEFGHVCLMLFIGLLVLNIGYGFEGSFGSLGEHEFISRVLTGAGDDVDDGIVIGNRFADGWLHHLPVPLPRNFLLGIDTQKWDFERGLVSYLGGEWSRDGWWYYYLYGLAVKVPLGIWGLGLMTLILALADRKFRCSSIDEFLLLAPALVVLVLVSSQTRLNHHMRYVLPVFPFLLVSIGRVARQIESREPERRTPGSGATRWILVSGLLIWAVVSSLQVYPHSIAYFNEMAGGPANGHKHLLQSNIDWGQGLHYLKDWQDDHPDARPFFLKYYLSHVPPEIAGIEYEAIPPKAELLKKRRLVPGWYAISLGSLHNPGKGYGYLNHFDPVDRIGWSIMVYHIEEPDIKKFYSSANPEFAGDSRAIIE